MRSNPFRVLGVPADVDERGLRAAFRRLVHELHPDRCAGDPRSTERLRQVVAAYEAASAQLRGASESRDSARSPEADAARSPVPRERLRYACARCEDTFAYDGECSHCEIALFDSWGHLETAVHARQEDPRVAPFVAALEARGEPRESMFERHAPQLTMLGLALAGALAIGVYAPVGTMFLGYAAFLGGVHMNELRRRAAL